MVDYRQLDKAKAGPTSRSVYPPRENFMSDRANFQKSYLTRYLVLAGFCLPLALWFFYDGLIGYPHQLTIAKEYDPLRELDPEERRTQWESIAKAKGWPTEAPEKKAVEIEDSIVGQYVWGFAKLVAGLVALGYYIRSRGSWVEPTATGLTTSWGQTFDFKDVVRVDKKKWDSKGIAKVTYRDNTLTRTFVFDDFKYDREPLGNILRTWKRHSIENNRRRTSRRKKIIEEMCSSIQSPAH